MALIRRRVTLTWQPMAKKEGVKTIGQGVQVKELKAGSGATPKASDVVKINYVGKTIDG